MKLCYPVATPDCQGSLMTFYGSLEDNFSTLRKYGYDGVELLVKNTKSFDIDKIMNCAKKNDLEIAALATSPIPDEDKLFLAHNDPRIRASALDRALDIARLAGELKVPMLVGKLRGLVDDNNPENNWTVLKQNLAALCRAAAPKGFVAVEIQQSGPVNTFCGTDESLARYDEIGADNFRLLPDIFHQYSIEKSVCAGLVKMRGKIGFVHLSDTERLVPGFGAVPFREVFPVFNAVGYKGYYSMEVKQKPDSDSSARLCIEAMNYFNGVVNPKSVPPEPSP